MSIINNKLKWDGSYLGEFTDKIITQHWIIEGTEYYELTLPPGWAPDLPDGILYCNAHRTKSVFPCIVEEIKRVFNLPKRGIHRIKINKFSYIIYYVPITINGEIIWETPLNRLDSRHILRADSKFRTRVQRSLAFCNILALSRTCESGLRIRPEKDENIVIICNETTTTLVREKEYDFNVISKVLFYKWFGEVTSIDDVVKEMVDYHYLPSDQYEDSNIIPICADLRGKIDKIIKKYDANYVWYTSFIIDRLSRHLRVTI